MSVAVIRTGADKSSQVIKIDHSKAYYDYKSIDRRRSFLQDCINVGMVTRHGQYVVIAMEGDPVQGGKVSRMALSVFDVQEVPQPRLRIVDGQC